MPTEVYLGRSPRFDSQISFLGLTRPADFRRLVLETKKMKMNNNTSIHASKEQDSSGHGTQSEGTTTDGIDIRFLVSVFPGLSNASMLL